MRHMARIIFINDLAWVAIAVLCVFCEHPALTGAIIVSTLIYAADLLVKFRAMHWELRPFVRRYWMDILLLVPVVKLFRGLRIIKVGRLLVAADATADFTEMTYRAWHAACTALRSRRNPPGTTGGCSRELPGE